MEMFRTLRVMLQNVIAKAKKSKTIIGIFDFLYVGIIGLNGHILLLINNKEESEMKYVISALTLSYVITLLNESFILRKKKKRRQVVYFTRKVFSIGYTLVYLTLIMLHLIRIGFFEGVSAKQMDTVWKNIILFIYVLITGTSCLWWHYVYPKLITYNVVKKLQKKVKWREPV